MANELDYLKNYLSKLEAETPEGSENLELSKVRNTKKVSVVLTHNKKSYILPVLDGMSVTWERKGAPGRLAFSFLKSAEVKPDLGDAVSVIVDGVNFFFGFVFTIRPAQEDSIDVTAYDSLRYMKNKDTYIYEKLTATKLLKRICIDYDMRLGECEDTKLPVSRIDDNLTLFDIMENNLQETLMATGESYILYDDYGKLRLRKPWRVNVLIDKSTAQAYNFSRSIDSEVYNKIKLAYDNEETGEQEWYVAQKTSLINKWGTLQLFEKIDSPELGALKAKMLLDMYSRESKSLSVDGCFGSPKVRAGCLLPVILNLYGTKVHSYMLVDKVTHTFSESEHFMALNLSGGDFDGV